MTLKYVKLTKAEFFIEGSLFTFNLKPYFLSLTFDHNLKSESETNKSVYNPDTFQLICKVEKENLGEHFENLNMINSLLTKPINLNTEPSGRPLIEEIKDEQMDGDENNEEEIEAPDYTSI